MADKAKEKIQAIPDPDVDPDIEILEVIGMGDEDLPPEDDGEVPVSFEIEPKPGLEEGESPRPGAPAPSRPSEGQDDSPREQLIRLHADFENLKKRVDREREEYFLHATRDLVARLLPVLDNLERAFVAGSQSPSDESVRAGVTLIHRQLQDELRREGLEPIDSVGQTFDPSVHEAVATDTSSSLPNHTVVEELQRGYFLRGQLLRPALVRVSVTATGTDESGRDEGCD